MTEDQYCNDKRGSFSYEGNSGHPEPTLVVSPHFTLQIADVEVPVYATVVYVGEHSDCALHSYAIVESDLRTPEGVFQNMLDIRLDVCNPKHERVIVLPHNPSVDVRMDSGIVHSQIGAPGDYTFVLTDADGTIDQYHSVTLFLRGYRDEDKEIRDYKEKYGEENVTVWEAGVHYVDHMEIEKDDSVQYFRRGGILIARGNPDYSDSDSCPEEDASGKTGLYLKRFPIISATGRRNIHFAGNGALDAGQLGWCERKGMLFCDCSDVEVSGLTILNIPEWSMIFYCCSDLRIFDVRIFGYKTNSDGIAVCNSSDVEVYNCFSRSGDDLFEVKTFDGGPKGLPAEDIVFRNCIAWAGKARCFGVIAELHRDVRNVLFKDCTVIVRDATWDNHILGSLVIICSGGDGRISDVVFEDIDICQDHGRAINIVNTDEQQDRRIVENIVFRNITYRSKLPDAFIAGDRGKNRVEALLIRVVRNGSELTPANIGEHMVADNRSRIVVDS